MVLLHGSKNSAVSTQSNVNNSASRPGGTYFKDVCSFLDYTETCLPGRRPIDVTYTAHVSCTRVEYLVYHPGARVLTDDRLSCCYTHASVVYVSELSMSPVVSVPRPPGCFNLNALQLQPLFNACSEYQHLIMICDTV